MVDEIKFNNVETSKADSKPNLPLLFVLLLFILIIIGVWIDILVDEGIGFSNDEKLNFTSFIETPICKEVFEFSKDKHTTLCCDSCNKLGMEYSYDLQYSMPNKIIDVCYCLDKEKINVFKIWDNKIE